jgi:hypothetical protein
MFLRFSDVFWITPVIYKKDSYIEASKLSAEFWSSIRRDPKSHREKKTKEKPPNDKAEPSQEEKGKMHLKDKVSWTYF